ncbi:MFS transporter [Brevibacillus centrosporus]|uniref:MFS transporter n=1 Tax=Brevibacillus centrosporus TaxID=54910 RepID=UPI000F0A2389|nr:MFS transporter [Brevibacillus centrosporus]MEC2127890.1 MFS transporter [Brevibacillus centrosporus]MED1953715.1 MFS transporter [Brevibacillus centrosporus]RNB68222.1 MFS transporter [Brevibacillus centrosporus]GED32864.1 MFS transporter [Brevibacillus centrosporus]
MDQSVLSIEKSTIRKTMARILPMILILYVVAYLDRVNLGYAALQMNAELALTSEVFGLLSGIFFIGYFFFEIPSNMIMHKVGAKMWIARIMLSWGIIVILTGFAQTTTHLNILRFLLGIAEAGFFPGIILYLTYWFRASERGRATAVLVLALPIGGLIGAPLSTWIMDNITWLQMSGWRWMFVLEGIPAILLGIVVIFYLTNKPSQAKWLTQQEKDWLEAELDAEQKASAQVNKASTREMLKDSKVWKLSLLYFGVYTAVYGLSFWMPTIIKSLSANATNNLQIGWLAMIPSVVAVPSLLFVGWNSDRTNAHKQHLFVCFLISIIGFIGCGYSSTLFWMVLMLTLTSVGLYGFLGSFFAYKTFFFTASTAPVGIALVNSFAALGGFVGPMILGSVAFTQGLFIISGILAIGAITLLTLKLTSNKKQHDTKAA